jgi:hypothetical protein
MLDAGASSPVVAISSDATPHKAQALSLYGLVEQWAEATDLGRFQYGVGARIMEIR